MSEPRIGGALLFPKWCGLNFGGPCANVVALWLACRIWNSITKGAGVSTPKISTGGDQFWTKVVPLKVHPQPSLQGSLPCFSSDCSFSQHDFWTFWQHEEVISSWVLVEQQESVAPVAVLTMQQQSGMVNTKTIAIIFVIKPCRWYIVNLQYTHNGTLGKDIAFFLE